STRPRATTACGGWRGRSRRRGRRAGTASNGACRRSRRTASRARWASSRSPGATCGCPVSSSAGTARARSSSPGVRRDRTPETPAAPDGPGALGRRFACRKEAIGVAQHILNAVALGSVYLVFALGMALAWSTIGILDFAHGATFMFSAFTAHVVTQQVALPMPAVVLVAVAAGALIATLTQVLAFGPIMRRVADHRAAELRILIG